MILEQLIQQARDEGKYLYCSYQNLWFSSDELAQSNKDDKFRWGAVNWELRDPQERIDSLVKSVRRQRKEASSLKRKMEAVGRIFINRGTCQFDDVEPR